MTCKDCRFWDSEYSHITRMSEPVGACTRFPPSVSFTWPMTAGTNWCGEFQKEPDENQLSSYRHYEPPKEGAEK